MAKCKAFNGIRGERVKTVFQNASERAIFIQKIQPLPAPYQNPKYATGPVCVIRAQSCRSRWR